ncbi:MAG: hypothetical protein A2Y75_08400 [Candidatus Solincola sediminis]|uniref:Glycosyltransferase RgtA/B/C/D-like domain-containing protein n=1 Tax=Candidatus Solincola sediminis TaxID=1797199 RepID=A0A1F2WLJ7_9ACTN|nr:MAG: hypothetical protein A2Y75_08400 [Candidatus Solincola sediminis]
MSGWKEHFLVILIFLILVIIFTLPFVMHAGSAVISGHVDNLLNVWITSWDNHALVTNPSALFQANMNYPSPDSLAFSEHLFIVSLLSAPIKWVTGNPILAYNLISLVGFALAGYTMYLLVKYLTHNRLAAFAAGAFFAFVPYHFSTIVHVHVSFYLLQPLLLLFLFKYFDEGRPRYLVGLGVTFLAQALLSWYQVAFSSIPIALFLIWQLISRRRREKIRYFAYTVAVLALCLVLVLPFALPYFRVHKNTPESESRPAINAVASAKARDYLRVLPQNYLYNKLGFFSTGNPGEGNSLFPGFLIFPLALIALIGVFLTLKRRRPGTPEPAPAEELAPNEDASQVPESVAAEDAPERAPPPSYFIYFIVLGAVSFLLALGPSPHGVSNLFYRALNKLPFYGFVRFPIRYHIMVIMALAVVVGYSCAYIYNFLKERKGGAWSLLGVGAIIALLLLEFAVFNLPFQPVAVGDAVPRVYRDLKDIDGAVVAELPLPYVENSMIYEDPLTLNFATLDNTFLSAIHEQDSVYFSTYHWKKLVNGLSGYYPLFYRRAVVESQSFPSRRSLDFLASAGVTYLVMHWDYLPPGRRDQLRAYLNQLPDLELVEDYEEGLSLYRLLSVETQPLEAMNVTPFFPQRAEPDASFSASLIFNNPGNRPFINLDEARQHLEVEWLNETGEVVRKDESYLYAPFFIEQGQGAVAAFKLNAPAPGNYSIKLTVLDGILKGSIWEADVTVRDVQSVRTADSSARLKTTEALSPQAGDVFSLPLELMNTGVTEWPRQGATVAGSVVITAIWTRDGDDSYKMQQQGMLPGDISAGQSASFPIALQAPREAGAYRLTLSLNCLGVTYIGEPLELPIDIH